MRNDDQLTVAKPNPPWGLVSQLIISKRTLLVIYPCISLGNKCTTVIGPIKLWTINCSLKCSKYSKSVSVNIFAFLKMGIQYILTNFLLNIQNIHF